MGERDTDWERAHLIRWEWYEGRRHRLGESALESGRERVEERDTDWERAHLIGWVRCEGGRHRLRESALDKVRVVWRKKTPTGRERT